jgi:hypothetical protein
VRYTGLTDVVPRCWAILSTSLKQLLCLQGGLHAFVQGGVALFNGELACV